MAKEKFEDRKLHGAINVACKYEDGTVRYWATEKETVVNHIREIVTEYARQGYPLTLRQLHYQLFVKNWIVNHDTAYKKLGTILDDYRYAGIIDWNAIEDRGRVPYIPYSVKDVTHALEDTIDQYRLNRQSGQRNNVELWTEKDALSGILRRVTQEYHVQLVVNKGYTSSSAAYRAYQRILQHHFDTGGITTILYLGDHDPSGLDMIRDIRGRLTFMLEKGEASLIGDDVLRVIPIGLSMSQIKQYNLPPNPTKLTDSRAEGYIKLYGKTCWEVDALRPQVLTQIVEDNITDQIDTNLYEDVLEQEKTGIEELRTFIAGRN